MGNVLIDREFEHLRVDHYELHILRGRLEKDAENHRIDGHRFSGSCGPGDQ